MTEKPTKPVNKRRKGDQGGKSLRDAAIRTLAAQGAKTTDIAEQFNLGRQQVSKILNDEETKQLVKEAENEVKGMVPLALAGLKEELQLLPGDPNRWKAIYSVLKNFGVLKDKVDISHSFPKPTIIRRRNGEEVILGVEEEK